MGRCKDVWMEEYESIADKVGSGEWTLEDAEIKLVELGFDTDEIRNHLDALREYLQEFEQ